MDNVFIKRSVINAIIILLLINSNVFSQNLDCKDKYCNTFFGSGFLFYNSYKWDTALTLKNPCGFGENVKVKLMKDFYNKNGTFRMYHCGRTYENVKFADDLFKSLKSESGIAIKEIFKDQKFNHKDYNNNKHLFQSTAGGGGDQTAKIDTNLFCYKVTLSDTAYRLVFNKKMALVLLCDSAVNCNEKFCQVFFLNKYFCKKNDASEILKRNKRRNKDLLEDFKLLYIFETNETNSLDVCDVWKKEILSDRDTIYIIGVPYKPYDMDFFEKVYNSIISLEFFNIPMIERDPFGCFIGKMR